MADLIKKDRYAPDGDRRASSLFCVLNGSLRRIYNAPVDIDQRLDPLTDRHEALTQSVDILTSGLRELRGIVVQIVGGIEKLAGIAESHERRLERLEDGE